MDAIYYKVIEAFDEKKHWFIDKGLKAPKYIDFYFGQPDDPENFEFVLPALFMDYAITSWKKVGKIYVGDVALQFHAIPEIAPGTNHLNSRMPQGLQIMTWYGLCRQVLDTVTGECFQTLKRLPENPAFTQDYKYHILGYGTEMDDIPGTEINRYAEGKIEEIETTGQIISKFSI